MKLSLIAAIAASAVYVSAAPLRVVVVSTSAIQRADSDPLAHIRFGRPVAASNANVAQLIAPVQAPDVMHRRPCAGRMDRMKQKSIEVANSIRKTFGLPLIEHPHPGSFEGKVVSVHNGNGNPTWITIGTPLPNGRWNGRTKGGDTIEILPVEHLPHPRPGRPEHPHHHNHGGFMHHGHGPQESFYFRLQTAIMSLGPWEGRAVAFVLGCGIGVLLRMFWVLGIVAYRSARGDDSEHEYSQINDEDDQLVRHTPISAPPTYIYPVDEKIAFETVPQVQATPNNETK